MDQDNDCRQLGLILQATFWELYGIHLRTTPPKDGRADSKARAKWNLLQAYFLYQWFLNINVPENLLEWRYICIFPGFVYTDLALGIGMTMSLTRMFVLKSILSYIRIDSPALFWLLSAWHVFVHPLTFNIFASLNLKRVSCRQHSLATFFYWFIFLSILPNSVFWGGVGGGGAGITGIDTDGI